MVSETVSTSEVEHEHVYSMLEEIFNACVLEADTSDLISNLGEIYESFSGQGFESSYEKILLIVLSDNKQSTEVNKILYFISESAVCLDNKYKTAAKKEGTTEDIDDIVHPLLKYLFKKLNRWSEGSAYTVRFRCCQLLFMIFTYIQDHGMGEIDMETYENTSKLIEHRRLDSSSTVRTYAVLLAKFFQDPSVVNDPVIAGLCWQMQYDPTPRVRQNIVSVLAACEETIMPIAKRFLYDKNAGVRNAALLHICKRIGPRSFTTYQRILILQQCFNDPSDLVRRNAEQKLIPVWFRDCGDKLCNFFKHIRMGNENLDNLPFIKELSKVLSKCVKISHVLEEIDLDSNSSLPKLPLSGERVFLWRHLFTYSKKDERLSKFFPTLDNLIPFILKCFEDSSAEEVEICVFVELTLFLMEIMDVNGIKNCEEVFPIILNLMRNPFVPHDMMPYLVSLYLTYSPKEKEQVHEDIFEVIEDLKRMLQFTEGQEKNILLKCFSIASQVLTDESTLTTGIKNIKDNLIILNLSSEDSELKMQAISNLALYCLLDIKEAKLSWPLFANVVNLDSSPLKLTFLESAFDLLKRHGLQIFTDISSNGQEKFDEALLDILPCLEGEEKEREIVLKGILKLYNDHHTSSPSILAKLVLLFFLPEDYVSIQNDLEEFFSIYGETEEGASCLAATFWNVINQIFEANKNSPLHKMNIKTVTLKLMEIFHIIESQNEFHVEEKFQDLVVVKLTKKFIKKPWRMTASDLYNVCSHIIPGKFESLLKLKNNVSQITESLRCSIFQQKNPYAKRSIKNFNTYLKKIQMAMNATPLIEEASKEEARPSPIAKKLNFNTSNGTDSYASDVDIHVDASPPKELTIDASLKENVELSPINKSNTSIKSPNQDSVSKTPSVTPRKIATASRTPRTSRLSRKDTPKDPGSSQNTVQDSPMVKTPKSTQNTSQDNHVFKTPGPRKTPGRKRNLDVTLTKTT